MDEQTARRDLIKICHLMYERSYVVSSDGNVSVRLDDGRILATPTMTCKGRMTEDLIARGFDVRGAGSGQEALDILAHGIRPCVMLLDLRMPQMDGCMVWTRMQADANNRRNRERHE